MRSRSWGRSEPAPKSGGTKKGLLMAAGPVIGGLVMKKMRDRKQTKNSQLPAQEQSTLGT